MAFEETGCGKLRSAWLPPAGLEVVEVELRGGGKSRMLRIFIDKPGGVTHEDCANFSREVGTILDVEDAVPGGKYVLEVSSPGLDRKLIAGSGLRAIRGQPSEVDDAAAGERQSSFRRALESFHDGSLTLDLSDGAQENIVPSEEAPQKLEIELANVEKANLVPEI